MKILISGAGIAGLTLAYWIKQQGFSPTVIEKHPFLRKGGYKVDIRGAALEIAKRMGIYQTLIDKNVNIEGSQFVTSDHQVYHFEEDILGNSSKGDNEVNRWDLCQILLNKMEEIEIIYEESITKFDESEGMVYFENMKPRKFDIVVGADGTYSTVRKLTFEDDSKFLKEQGIHFCVFPTSNLLELNRSEVAYLEKKKLIAAYSVNNNSFACLAFKNEEKKLPSENLKTFFEKQFKESGWETPRILAAMKESEDCYFGSITQVRMPHWSKGRVVLVGDAAYAAHGISTSMAIVGAFVLACELGQSKGDYSLAFSNYEKAIRKFVERGQDLSESNYQILVKGDSSWLLKFQLYLMQKMPAKFIRYLSKWEKWKMKKAANAINLEKYF